VGLHREIRRLRTLGAHGYALRTGNDVLSVINRVAPPRHQCPCCGWRGWRFLHYIGKGYQVTNVVCPVCKSQPRQRGLYFFLKEVVAELPPGARILHLAPERSLRGILTQRPDLKYLAADLNLLDWIHTGLRAVRADFTAMPFRDGAFAMVVCSHVLEHIHDDAAALREIARIVAPGGRVIIMVPTYQPWNSQPTTEFGCENPDFDNHWRTYGADVADRIAATGLKVSTHDFSAIVSAEKFVPYGLVPDTVFIGAKP
jgi:SAM-dependent methyltransferase